MKLLHVVGARPNFPKLAPVHRAASGSDIEQTVVHTGQHYDDALSERPTWTALRARARMLVAAASLPMTNSLLRAATLV